MAKAKPIRKWAAWDKKQKRKHAPRRNCHSIAWPVLGFFAILCWWKPGLLILVLGGLAAGVLGNTTGHTEGHSDAHGDGNGVDT